MLRRTVAVLTGIFILSLVAASQTPVVSPTPGNGPTGIFTVYDGGPLRKGDFTVSPGHNGPTVRNEKLTSKLMGREMPYRVVLPSDYGNEKSSERFAVIYLLHGLTGHFDNWTDKTKLAEYIATRRMIVVTPEGENGWYTDSATKSTDKYESYIIKELIPEIDKNFRTDATRDQRAVAGLSMGGYGAIKFGLKYPEMFSLAGSFSGAIGAATITEKTVPGAIGKSVDAIFGPAGGEARKSNDPFLMIRNASPDQIKKFPFLYIDCGTEDFLFKNNRDFVELLLEKNVPHEFRQLPGGHNWKYWNAQVDEFIELASSRLLAQ